MSIPNATVPMSELTNYPKILVPTGTHFARIFKILDLGTQTSEYKGDEKINRQFSISFEFPKIKHEFRPGEGEKPLARSKDVNFIFTSKNSTLRSALTDLVEAVGDNPFEGNYNIFSLLGKACQVKIEYYTNKKGEERDKITSFSTLSDEQKEMAKLKPEIYAQVNPSQYLYLEAFNVEVFNSLPSWLKDKIGKSPEFQKLNVEIPKEEKVDVEKLPDIDVSNLGDVEMPF